MAAKFYWVNATVTFKAGCFVKSNNDTQALMDAKDKIEAAILNTKPDAVASERDVTLGIAEEEDTGV